MLRQSANGYTILLVHEDIEVDLQMPLHVEECGSVGELLAITFLELRNFYKCYKKHFFKGACNPPPTHGC